MEQKSESHNIHGADRCAGEVVHHVEAEHSNILINKCAIHGMGVMGVWSLYLAFAPTTFIELSQPAVRSPAALQGATVKCSTSF